MTMTDSDCIHKALARVSMASWRGVRLLEKRYDDDVLWPRQPPALLPFPAAISFRVAVVPFASSPPQKAGSDTGARYDVMF